jgi:hypothetical protein
VYVKDHHFAKRKPDLEVATVECVWLELVIPCRLGRSTIEDTPWSTRYRETRLVS